MEASGTLEHMNVESNNLSFPMTTSVLEGEDDVVVEDNDDNDDDNDDTDDTDSDNLNNNINHGNNSDEEEEDNDEEDEDPLQSVVLAAHAAAQALSESDKAEGLVAAESVTESPLLPPSPFVVPTCRICGRHDGRALLRFLPVPYDAAALKAAPVVTTFCQDVALHIFCGKTASILPHVQRPDLEILTKAGLKNKHGIGPEVNAALARTRSATLPADTKQFYLVREFEAHLAAIRNTHVSFPFRQSQGTVPTLPTLPSGVPVSAAELPMPPLDPQPSSSQEGGLMDDEETASAMVLATAQNDHHLQHLHLHHNPLHEPHHLHQHDVEIDEHDNNVDQDDRDDDDDDDDVDDGDDHVVVALTSQEIANIDAQLLHFSYQLDATSPSPAPLPTSLSPLPVHKAGATTAKHERASTRYSSSHSSSDLGKVFCECGGTYHPNRGSRAWRKHTQTKRHQSWVTAQLPSVLDHHGATSTLDLPDDDDDDSSHADDEEHECIQAFDV